jgi:hypothetical protein
VSRPLVALTAALAIAVTATAVAGSPARADVAVPVSCSSDKVVIEWDDLSYDLNGTCGVVVVKASNVKVTMPAAVRLVVKGRHNTIDARPLTTLVVRGGGHDVATPSVRYLRMSSPRTTLAVEGLVEDAVLAGRNAHLGADQVSDLLVTGDDHDVRARRGYDSRIEGDGNQLAYRRLESVVLTGHHNRVDVRAGRTEVHDRGSDNRVRIR